MKQKLFLFWLKLFLICIAVGGLALFAFALPALGLKMKAMNPEFSHCFWPWLIFLLISGLPCFAVLVLAGKLLSSIEKNMAFSFQNATLLKTISILAAADTAFFFAGNVVFLFLGMNHPGILLMSLAVDFAGLTVAALFAVLSQLVRKAAELQEQSDLTI